jgi:hypothetical protein
LSAAAAGDSPSSPTAIPPPASTSVMSNADKDNSYTKVSKLAAGALSRGAAFANRDFVSLVVRIKDVIGAPFLPHNAENGWNMLTFSRKSGQLMHVEVVEIEPSILDISAFFNQSDNSLWLAHHDQKESASIRLKNFLNVGLEEKKQGGLLSLPSSSSPPSAAIRSDKGDNDSEDDDDEEKLNGSSAAVMLLQHMVRLASPYRSFKPTDE